MGKYLNLGVLAHVDAGKTTLCEGLLYLNKTVTSFGRVDKGASFLDFDPLERQRGITIFSKQAIIVRKDKEITLLDTPGHVDFVWETLSCINVMDAALLVMDASAGLLPHSIRLYNLLRDNNVPVIIFFNKMDLYLGTKDEILSGLSVLSGNFVDFTDEGGLFENLATCSEELMEKYLDDGNLSNDDIISLISRGDVTPVYFGSALINKGLEKLNDDLFKFISVKSFSGPFLPFKVSHNEKGNLLIHGRVGNECLVTKGSINDEKIEEILRFNGSKASRLEEASPGMLVALRGPVGLQPRPFGAGAYKPLFLYELKIEGMDSIRAYQTVSDLAEELPSLDITPDPENDRIIFSPMGEIQLQILKELIRERCGVEAEFSPAGVLYKETVASPVLGVGHFEPLRHYAEVHLLIEPNPGGGIMISSDLDSSLLSSNYQSQILFTLSSTAFPGTAIGAELTDIKITLVAGKAHIKHTEGGDFREATIRALRQGLMMAGCDILEPMYAFLLSLPQDLFGKVMKRIEEMEGELKPPEFEGDLVRLKGSFPASKLSDFPTFIAGLTSGAGELSLEFGGYSPVKNPDEIILNKGYSPVADMDFPLDSVFVSHGGSDIVPWYEAYERMHLPLIFEGERDEDELSLLGSGHYKEERFIGVEEVDALVARAGGANKRSDKGDRRSHFNRYKRTEVEAKIISPSSKKPAVFEKKDDYLLVDGYNIIFALESLRSLSEVNIESAKDALVDMLSEYTAYTGVIVILVFDAYKVRGGLGSVSHFMGIDIVYTKEAQTADAYIEKTSHELARKHNVTVATGDRLEQIIVWGSGAMRLSPTDFLGEIMRVKEEIKNHINRS